MIIVQVKNPLLFLVDIHTVIVKTIFITPNPRSKKTKEHPNSRCSWCVPLGRKNISYSRICCYSRLFQVVLHIFRPMPCPLPPSFLYSVYFIRGKFSQLVVTWECIRVCKPQRPWNKSLIKLREALLKSKQSQQYADPYVIAHIHCLYHIENHMGTSSGSIWSLQSAAS